MDDTQRKQRIEHLAREIWEAEGRPDGQAERHWAMAERLVEAEALAAGASPLDSPPSPDQGDPTTGPTGQR